MHVCIWLMHLHPVACLVFYFYLILFVSTVPHVSSLHEVYKGTVLPVLRTLYLCVIRI